MASTAALDEARHLCEALGVLAEPHRLLVLRHLRRGARSAGFLAKAAGMSPSLASHHLAVLAEAGLISRRQQGPYICYSANRRRVSVLFDRLERMSGVSGVAAGQAAGREDPC